MKMMDGWMNYDDKIGENATADSVRANKTSHQVVTQVAPWMQKAIQSKWLSSCHITNNSGGDGWWLLLTSGAWKGDFFRRKSKRCPFDFSSWPKLAAFLYLPLPFAPTNEWPVSRWWRWYSMINMTIISIMLTMLIHDWYRWSYDDNNYSYYYYYHDDSNGHSARRPLLSAGKSSTALAKGSDDSKGLWHTLRAIYGGWVGGWVGGRISSRESS